MDRNFSRWMRRGRLLPAWALFLTGAACKQDATSPSAPAELSSQGVIHIVTPDGASAGVTALFYGAKLPDRGVPRDGCVSSETVDTSYPPDWVLSDKSAGTVTATTGGAETKLDFHPGSTGSASAFYDIGSKLAANAPVTIHATGDDVPEFIVTAQPPAALKLVTRLDDGISKNGDYELTWEPTTSADFVDINLSGIRTTVLCRTTSNRGRFVVPGAQLRSVTDAPFTQALNSAMEPAHGPCGASCVQLEIASYSLTRIYAGDYDIAVDYTRRLVTNVAIR